MRSINYFVVPTSGLVIFTNKSVHCKRLVRFFPEIISGNSCGNEIITVRDHLGILSIPIYLYLMSVHSTVRDKVGFFPQYAKSQQKAPVCNIFVIN